MDWMQGVGRQSHRTQLNTMHGLLTYHQERKGREAILFSFVPFVIQTDFGVIALDCEA